MKRPFPPLRRAIVTAALGFTFASGAVAQADAPKSIISPASEASVVTKAAAVDRTVIRQRPILVDLAGLERETVGKAPISLELFDGTVVVLDPARVERRGSANFTYFGKVRGNPKSEAILTVVAGHLAALITVQDPRGGSRGYRIESQPGIGHWLQEINPDAFPVDHPPGEELLVAPPEGKSKAAQTVDRESIEAKADSGAIVDLLVVYSDQTAAAAGSAIGSQIQAAVDAANLTLANSGVSMRLRLVHYAPANYSESGAFDTDLSRLRGTTDGHMDFVHSMRDTYSADLVSLFVETSSACGYGYIGPSAGSAFTVVNRGCAAGNYTLAHEIGHNFGARHDPYVDSATSPYANGHGHADIAGRWRTVMAYNNVCAAANVSCTRIGYWSNPNVLYNGAPTGTPANGTSPTSDNASVLNKAAYSVANFRVSSSTPGCTYALSPSFANVAAGGDSGSTTVTAGNGCAWNAVASGSWITVGAGSGTSGNGTLYYTVAPNSNAARSGSISVGNQSFAVSQASGCTYAVTPLTVEMGASGGTGSASISTSSGCTWTATSGTNWITITSGASGTGNGTVSYKVTTNPGSMRTGNLQVGPSTVIVTQDAVAATPSPVPAAVMSPTSLSFGNVAVTSTSRTKTATFTNSGGTSLTIAGVSRGGANPTEFAVASNCAGVLAVGASCTLQIAFTPNAAGGRSATITVSTNEGALAGLAVSGTGKARGAK